MDLLEDDLDKIKISVRFVTKLTKYKVTEKPFHVPASVTRTQLSKTINHLLGIQKDPVAFDFLINNEFLRTSLDTFLKRRNRSREEIIEIEYVEAQTPPEQTSTNTHPDWISAIDNKLIVLNAALRASNLPTVIPYGSYDNRVWLRQAHSKDENEPVMIGEHTQPVTCISSRVDVGENITLVSGSQDQTLKVWQVSVGDATASLVATLTGHEAGVEAAEISPDGNMLCSGAWDNQVKLWSLKPLEEEDDEEDDTSKKRRKKKQKRQDTDDITDIPTEPVSTLSGHAGCVSALCWISDNMVASGSWDHSIHIWDVGSGVSTQRLNGNKSFLSLKFSASNKLLLSGATDKTIRIWDPRISGAEVSVYENQAYSGHTGWVKCVAWHPTNSYSFLSASYDGSIKVWDLRSRMPLHTLSNKEDNDKILDLQWVDNKEFVTGGADSTLRFYRYRSA